MFLLTCAKREHPLQSKNDVSMSIVEVTDSKIVLKLENRNSYPIFVNQQLAYNSRPAFLGAAIICTKSGTESRHGEINDASLPLLPIGSGEVREFTVFIFTPLSRNAEMCIVSTSYLDNPRAVELIYKSTQSPGDVTREDHDFILKSERHISARISTGDS